MLNIPKKLLYVSTLIYSSLQVQLFCYKYQKLFLSYWKSWKQHDFPHLIFLMALCPHSKSHTTTREIVYISPFVWKFGPFGEYG